MATPASEYILHEALFEQTEQTLLLTSYLGFLLPFAAFVNNGNNLA